MYTCFSENFLFILNFCLLIYKISLCINEWAINIICVYGGRSGLLKLYFPLSGMPSFLQPLEN